METALLQAHRLKGRVTQQGSSGLASRRETPNGRQAPGVERPAALLFVRYELFDFLGASARGRGQVARIRAHARSLACFEFS
jgi:hypothetical protein